MPINLLKKPGTQSPWCCSWGYSDMLVEIDFFVHKFLLDNCLRIIEKEKKLMITFFVKLHQDVVLEDHLVVGEKCLIYKT